MSSGYSRLAKIDTPDGPLSIDECWGGYALDDGRDYGVSLDVIGNGHAELYLAEEQVRELAAQIAEYFARPAPEAVGSVVGDVDLDDLPF